MFSQPFCVSETRILVCTCDMVIFAIDMGTASPSMNWHALGCETPSTYFGAAVSEATGLVCISESFQCTLILLDQSLKLVRVIELSRSVESPGALSARSIVRAYGRFWFTAHWGDFETKLGRLDEGTDTVFFAELSNEWQVPPSLNMFCWPVVLVHHGCLALFNDFVETLYWLDDNCKVLRTMKMSSKAVLGPSLSGDLVVLLPTGAGVSISIIDHSATLVPLVEILEKPWSQAEGICQWSDRILVLDEKRRVHSYSLTDSHWSLVGDCS